MDFREAEQQFQALEHQRQAGLINAEAYRAALGYLRVVDASGATWQMQEYSGRWFVFRDGQWVQAVPPAQQPALVRAPVSAPRSQAARSGNGQTITPPRSQAQPQRRQVRPAEGKRSPWNVILIVALVGACGFCGLATGGGYLAYREGLLPESITGIISLPTQSSKSEAPVEHAQVKPVEAISVPPDGAPHADAHGVSLAVPAKALPEGEQANLSGNEIKGPWSKSLETDFTIDTPFYTVAAQGKNDSAGRLAMSFPATSPDSRVMAVIDDTYLVQLAVQPEGGKLEVQVRAGTGDKADPRALAGLDGSGSIYYTVITPRKSSSAPGSGANGHLARFTSQPDARNCIPGFTVTGGASINLCRQNEDGTIQVLLPLAKRDLAPQVDVMIDKIEAVMKKYSALGFTTAQLSKSAPMTVRVSTTVTSPSYYPLNGVLYIPVDTVSSIATQSPVDVYHEMAHWIQDEEYNTTAAFYSEEKTWWIETSAENMVMLVEPAYVGNNLSTYGTITQDNGALAFQASPYQWPADFYVQAQLLKVNLCDSPACPLSQADLAKAISTGAYPLMDGGKKSLVGSNLVDYAYYLLGKSPVKANTSIPLNGPVRTGDGYGEYITVKQTKDIDIKFDYNGSNPQMRIDSKDGKDALAVEASLQRDGVYPLVVAGAENQSAGLPAELVIQPGAPFYYTIDGGELKYSDGSAELSIKPIHSKMGIKKIRLVAIGQNGGEVFKARVQPLDMSGAWVVYASGPVSGSIPCVKDDGSADSENEMGKLGPLLIYFVGAMGDMSPDPTGRNLDWSLVPARLPEGVSAGDFTYQATTLLTGAEVRYQGQLGLPSPSESYLPAGNPVGELTPEAAQATPAVLLFPAALGVPAVWLLRKRPKQARLLLNLLVIGFLVTVSTGCGFGMAIYGTVGVDATIDKIEFTAGQDTGVVNPQAAPQGKPMWKMTGKATYDVNLVLETELTTLDNGLEGTTEKSITTCSGKATAPITVYVYQDVQIQVNQDE